MDGRTRILVIVSLVVNLFLAGALIGVLVVGARFAHERSEARRGDRPGIWSAFQAIPPERRAVLERVMREQAVAAAPDLRAAREARQGAARLIAAPTYDAAGVEAALKQARDSEAQARAKVDAALATRLSQLSPEERVAFARVMLRGPRGGGGGDRDRGRDGRRGPREGRPPPGQAPAP